MGFDGIKRREYLEGKVLSSVMRIVNLKCLVDTHMKMFSKWLDFRG